MSRAGSKWAWSGLETLEGRSLMSGGLMAAGMCGMLLGILHGLLCSLQRVNDIAIGISLMLLGTGLAFFFGKAFVQPKAPALCRRTCVQSGDSRTRPRSTSSATVTRSPSANGRIER